MIFEMRDEIKYYKPMIIELNKIFQQANILLIRSVRTGTNELAILGQSGPWFRASNCLNTISHFIVPRLDILTLKGLESTLTSYNHKKP